MTVRYDIIKTYPKRGPLQQYRLGTICSFSCFRCGQEKTSKLVTVANGSWANLLCNGCYGRLISLHEIRDSSKTSEEKAELVAVHLTQLIPLQQARAQESLLRQRQRQSDLLDTRSLRFIATAECVAENLLGHTELDWSAALIGLCKAFEVELVQRLIEPLRISCDGQDINADINDSDLRRIARYCAGNAPPPELGSVRHFLEAATRLPDRVRRSPLLANLRSIVKKWPHADWLFQLEGGLTAIGTLTSRYRNRAAHNEVLTRDDYLGCHALVVGTDGVLWKLCRATSLREK